MNRNKILFMLLAGFIGLLLLSFFFQISPYGRLSKTETLQVHQKLTSSPASGALLRFNASLEPRKSEDSAIVYYARREKMIRDFYGDSQIEKPLASLRSANGSTSEILTALDAVRRQETVEAIPYIVKLLTSDDLSVEKSAAEVLCFFGDHRGFNFIIQRMTEAGGFDDWYTLLSKVLIENKITEYNGDLIKIMDESFSPDMSSTIKSFEVAKLLVSLGDESGVRVISKVFKDYPPDNPESVVMLFGLKNSEIREIAYKLVQNGLNDNIKRAALVVLAQHGDAAAISQVLAAAGRTIGLQQPKFSDGTDKPDLLPAVMGGKTIAWDDDAAFALEHGMQFIDPVQSVPVLRNIALNAENVRFSKTAIEQLAKIGTADARSALWDVARSVQTKKRPFEESLYTTTGKALVLFDDTTSTSLAAKMFSGDVHGMESSIMLAEFRGWDGLFKLDLFY